MPDDRLSEYEFQLPPELIATQPAKERDGARLLVYDRSTDLIQHAAVRDLPRFLKPTDLLVLNDSKVRPANLMTADGKLEALLLDETSPRNWVSLVKPGAKAKPGMRLVFASLDGSTRVEADVLKTLPGGERVLRFFGELPLDRFGTMPVPPYIRKQRAAHGQTEICAEDTVRYQTTFARAEGSVAAPTAGLHFTPELLSQFNHAFVTLHVGLGTFRPVKTEFLEDHDMHEEVFSIPEGFAEKYEKAERIVAVGTTSARVLEGARALTKGGGRTRIFIRTPYEFQRVDCLVTNFHLPHSTLLMLVSAMVGRKRLLEIYAEAIREKYRFFSYGDAMLIL